MDEDTQRHRHRHRRQQKTVKAVDGGKVETGTER